MEVFPAWAGALIRMKSRAIKIAVIFLAVLGLIFLAASLGLRWYVNSGKLQTLIEAKASEALNSHITMSSIRFSWPFGIAIDGLEVSARGHEESPIMTCSRLKIAATIWNIWRKHVDTLVLVGLRVSLKENENGELNIPQIPPSDEPYTAGTIKIIDGDVDVDISTAEAKIKGILLTLSEPSILSRDERTLRINFDSAEAAIGEKGKERLPVGLKLFQSYFVLKSEPLKNEVKADVGALVTTKIPSLLLPPDTPLGVSFELDYLPESDSLENAMFSFKIPAFTNASVYGSVKGLTSEAPVPDLNLTIRAPEIAKLNEYNELLQRPTYKDMNFDGKLEITGTVKGELNAPQISLRTSIEGGTFDWEDIAVKGLSIDIPMNAENKHITAGPGEIRASRASIPIGDEQIVVEDIRLGMPVRIDAEDVAAGPGRLNIGKVLVPVAGETVEMTSLTAEVSADKSRASLNDFKVEIGGTNQLLLEGTYEFESARIRGKASIPEARVSDLLALIPASIYALPADLALSGNMDVACDIDAKMGEQVENLDAKYRVSFRDGELSSGEFLAVAGIDADLEGHVEADAPTKLLKFGVGGNVSDFELLVDTFYKDFSGKKFPFSVSAEYSVDAKQLTNMAASLDLGSVGTVGASGAAQFASSADIALNFKTDKIDLHAVVEELGEELLSEISPLFKEADVAGSLFGDIAVRVADQKLSAGGTIHVEGGHMVLGQGSLALGSVNAVVPFDMYLPQGEPAGSVQFNEQDYGRISIDDINAGPVKIPSLVVNLALKQNALSVKGPTSIDLFGGTLNVGNIRGDNLLGPSARIRTSVLVDNIDVGLAAKAMELPEVVGALNANLPEMTLTWDALTATGASTVNLFGGTIDIGSLAVEQPLSPVRTIKADLEFRDIDLSRVTKVLEFGSITGIMEGTLKGFELSQGQPAAFVADFETIKRKRVAQKINFAAVENITILGTGRGFQAGVGRGIATFFDEFGYDKIGFYCSLKNDNFIMKGKVVENGTEYFVKGVTFGPQINVINRNPGQTVSFKSMVERISRVKRQESKDK